MFITGISTEQAVYKWYRGESIPALETMLILCDALGITIYELLVIDGEFAVYSGLNYRFNDMFSDVLYSYFINGVKEALCKCRQCLKEYL